MKIILIMIISIVFIITYTAAHEEKNTIKSLLVFAHPDDETWMNGTIAKLVNNGYTLHLIYVTSGDKGSDRSGRDLKDALLAEEREKEVINALSILGVVDNINFLRYPDGQVQENIFNISKDIEEKINKINPELVNERR